MDAEAGADMAEAERAIARQKKAGPEGPAEKHRYLCQEEMNNKTKSVKLVSACLAGGLSAADPGVVKDWAFAGQWA